MKRRSRIALFALALIFWAVPFWRVGGALLEVLDEYYNDSRTINAWNDVTWNAEIFSGYCLLFATTLVSVRIFHVRCLWRWSALILAALGAAFYCIFPYERVIVLFPVGNPFSSWFVAQAVATFCAFAMVQDRIKRRLPKTDSPLTVH